MSKRKPRAKHTSREDVKRMHQIVDELLVTHELTVKKRSRTPTGRAYYDKSIKIPYPTNIEKFCVCLHEIGHHVNDAMYGEDWEREYKAEVYALQIAKAYGFDISAYEIQAKRYVLVYIAESLRKGDCLSSINKEVKDFVYSELDVAQWYNRKPYFSEWGNKYHIPLNIVYL